MGPVRDRVTTDPATDEARTTDEAQPENASAAPRLHLGANLAALRGHNSAVVLGLLRDAGERGASRTELAARTGLTPQAVSKITARLRAARPGRRGGTPRIHRRQTGGRAAPGPHRGPRRRPPPRP
ncbi:hypothetical protein GCM10020000_51130 [Streptomyces olivoverticillatus]